MNGEHTAPDGWKMTWDTDAEPASRIEYHDETGICKRITSGGVDDVFVHRRLVEFKLAHSGQLRMAL